MTNLLEDYEELNNKLDEYKLTPKIKNDIQVLDIYKDLNLLKIKYNDL